LGDDPAKGAGGIGAGEDVFVHEETPARRMTDSCQSFID
jgi:hypothetical protein